MKLDRNPKYGSYWKAPYFSFFSMIPFYLLYEETNWFWIPFFLAFVLAITSRRTFPNIFIPILFVLAVLVSWIHHQLVAPIDLLFFGRLLLFIQLGLFMIPMSRSNVITIYFLNFVLVLVGGALTYRFWFALYSVIFFFALSYLYLELSLQKFQLAASSRSKTVYTLKLVTFLLIAGYVLFLFVPRAQFDQISSQLGISISGFSSQISLDDISDTLESNQVVMRVKTKGSPSYYRGLVLDYFDGKTWKNTTNFFSLQSSFNSGYGLKIPSRLHDLMSEVQEFEFQALPSKNKHIFIPEYSRSIEIDPPFVEVNSQGDLQRRFNLTRSQEYKVYSYLVKRPRTLLANKPEVSPGISERYLQLPKVSSRVRKLAEFIVRNEDSHLGKINAIHSFFDKSFQYSLRSYHPGDPIEDFLLNNRVGHCQYFAAAMVVLLRLNGIPSRVVNGFTSGEYNEYGDYWTVRMKHAHAWVQVYAGNGLWVTEDPTPVRHDSWFGSGFFQIFFEHLNKVGEYFDAIWQSSVLYFSKVDQSLFLASIFSWWENNPLVNTIVLILILSSLFLLFGIYYKSFEIRYRSTNPWVRRLDKWLRVRGIRRHPSQGFLEVSEGVQFDEDTLVTLKSFFGKIYQLEFQTDSNSRALEKDLKRLWKKLKSSKFKTFC